MSETTDMIDVCITHRGALTEWEEKFIDDIAMRVDEGRELSMKQTEVLERIHTKCVRRRR